MNNLFNGIEDVFVPKEKNNDLKIVPNKGKKLSKNQQTFNTLIKKIEFLNSDIEKSKLKLEKLVQEHSKRIPPIQKKYAERQIETAKAFGKSTESIKFSAKQKKAIQKVILWLCNEAFSLIEPDQKTKDFYDSWAEKSYDNEIKEQKSSTLESLANEFKFMYGIDIDFSDIDDSPEGFARLQERIQKTLGEQQQQHEPNPSSKRKKTKKQLEQEVKQKEEESVILKSIRSIYISLAKMLHPDTVTDEAEKLKKEELMKKVTVAYNEKDISILLKLEMEFVVSESNHLDDLADDKLKIYISSLKEQAKELEEERYMLYNHPRFMDIIDYAHLEERHANKRIQELVETYKTKIATSEFLINIIQENSSKKVIMDYVNEIKDVIEDEEDFNDFFGDFGMR